MANSVVSNFAMSLVQGAKADMNLTTAMSLVSYSDGPSVVNSNYVQTLVSYTVSPSQINSAFVMIGASSIIEFQVPETNLDVDSKLEGFDLENYENNVKPAAPIRELNPYRPDTPDELRELGQVADDYLKEQAELIRQQHMLIQAGDSTFGWEVLTKTNKNQEYTLGSLGRFFHDKYGIILARYVQFVEMVQTPWTGAPVGRLKDSVEIDWRVTNDFSKSGKMLVMGLGGPYETPHDGEYGWMIVGGANIQSIPTDNVVVPKADAPLIWSGTASSLAHGSGKVFGRVWGNPNSIELLPGYVFVTLEGESPQMIKDWISDLASGLEEEIQLLTQMLDDLKDQIPTQQLLEMQRQLATLSSRITQEELNRMGGDRDLQAQIAAINAATVDWGPIIDALSQSVATSQAKQDQQINLNRETADAALALANQLKGRMDTEVSALQTTVRILQDRVYELADESTPGLPLVTGETPGPNFITDEYGQCILAG